MSVVIGILAVAGILALIAWVISKLVAERRRGQPKAVDSRAAAAEFPDPGEGSPRVDGEPVRGSQADRERHGRL